MPNSKNNFDNMIDITVFTPTYNRAHTLKRLYFSLLEQTYKNFEWILIDDGSTDSTESLVGEFVNIPNNFSVRYFKQTNGGKHRAINHGLEKAQGEFFFIVDSDDFLLPSALEKIIFFCNEIKNDSKIAGVVGRKGYNEKTIIGSKQKLKKITASTSDLRFKYKIKGDLAEVFKTSILKQYLFPDIQGEKFAAEGLMWNKIAQKYKVLFFNEIIYVGEYLDGGLTSLNVQNRMNSPQYSMLLYNEKEKMNIPLTEKIKANINYWRFSFYSKITFIVKYKRTNYIFSLIGIPVGYFAHLIDEKKLKKK